MRLTSLTRLKERQAARLSMKRRHDAFQETLSAAAAGQPAAMTPGNEVLRPLAASDGVSAEAGSLWALILTVFPDICPHYVEGVYQAEQKRIRAFPDDAVLINAILEAGPYPTLQERKRRKIEEKEKNKGKWSPDDGVVRDKHYYNSARALLRLDYPDIPVQFLKSTLQRHITLYAAYQHLYYLDSNYTNLADVPYGRLKVASRREKMPLFERSRLAKAHRDTLTHEFQDARNMRVQKEEKERKQAEADKLEAANEAAHAATGGLMECQCCYTDAPINRMIPCAGDQTHFFCQSCIKANAETQIGYMRYEIHCMDTSGCNALFSQVELADILGTALMRKIDDLRQRDEIEKAEIDGLEECPFCDFKAIYPPVEENREFRCLKSECWKVSCRSCKGGSHVPKTCDEARKEKNIPVRHKIEEAMSEAIIRICPNSKCKMPIVKADGCNKLYCTKCRWIMCYVCKKDISKDGYHHFTGKGGSCPLHDYAPSEGRHYQEAALAQKTATEEALKSHPELKETDLEVDLPKTTFADIPGQNILGLPLVNQLYAANGPGAPRVHGHQPGFLERAGNQNFLPALPQEYFQDDMAEQPFQHGVPWDGGPRPAPVVQENAQPAVNNTNQQPAVGGQLRQRLFEEQRFQRNPANGAIPAVRPADLVNTHAALPVNDDFEGLKLLQDRYVGRLNDPFGADALNQFANEVRPMIDWPDDNFLI
ncbi:hypothetical protein DIZ76_012210 [Coccidioides immitis]|nr:hypothetical protein DIZ76_012210 [Coccidioides immitis]